MAEAFIRIDGLGVPDLQDRLKKFPIKVQRKLLRGVMRRGAKTLLAETIKRVPVLSGSLRESLKIKALKRRRGSFGVTIATGTREELGIAPDDDGYYPAVIEYGSEHVPQRSYLRKTMQDLRPSIIAQAKDDLELTIRDEERVRSVIRK